MVYEFFEFSIKTNKREEIIDITEKIYDLLKKSKIKNGICLIYVPHATSAVIINENYDKAVCDDIIEWLKDSIPKGIWKHDKIDNNADSHIKSSLLGCDKVLIVKDKKLLLGKWQGIGFVELDGPRERKINVLFFGE
ncbi:MAG: secondary thiamine-phosphate synthase enzyme YjbQ [Candidatus Pacearchaeota archaeon]